MIEQLAIAIFLAWILQMVLAYRQAHIFYRRVNSLKKMGRCATGLAGGRYRGRTYVALVADPQTRLLIRAEQLRGMTVFAGLKPIPQLEGRSLDELLTSNVLSIEGVPQRVIEAARSAAEAIQASLNKATIPASSPVLS